MRQSIKNRQIPLCCGARIIYDFYNKDNDRTFLLDRALLDKRLKDIINRDYHSAIFMAITNGEQQYYEATFKANGFEEKAQGYNYGGRALRPLKLWVWARPKAEKRG